MPSELIFLFVFFFVGSIISTVMFVIGKKRLSKRIEVTVDLNDSSPQQYGETNFQYEGTFKIGDKTWNFHNNYPGKVPLPVKIYCEKGKDDYEKENNCLGIYPSSPMNQLPYLERNVKRSRDAMITFCVFFALTCFIVKINL